MICPLCDGEEEGRGKSCGVYGPPCKLCHGSGTVTRKEWKAYKASKEYRMAHPVMAHPVDSDREEKALVAKAKTEIIKMSMDVVQRSGLSMIGLEVEGPDVPAAIELCKEGLGNLAFLPNRRADFEREKDFGIFGASPEVMNIEQPKSGAKRDMDLGFELVQDEHMVAWEERVLAVPAEIDGKLAEDLTALAVEAVVYQRQRNVKRLEAVSSRCMSILDSVESLSDARGLAASIAWHWIRQVIHHEDRVMQEATEGELVGSQGFAKVIPILVNTVGTIARRRCWDHDDGYPAGEGVIHGKARGQGWNEHRLVDRFVWSRDRSEFHFNQYDLTASDWYITTIGGVDPDGPAHPGL